MNERTSSPRVVAIVGRPNVGKSALFNRLAGRRIAIVHAEPGVTRDRITCEAAWGEQRFTLVDTGGIAALDRAKTDDEIVRGTRQQVDAALTDAAVVLFVTDIAAGVVPLDEEVARRLHAGGHCVLLAANKADNPLMERGLDDFAALGFPVYAVSAAHGRGVDELMRAVVAELPEGENPTREDPLRVAVVGRPNVGKSSFINRLLGSERVIVSERPGTTRDSVDIPFAIGRGDQSRRYLLTDTAGLRKLGRVHGSVERFSVFRAEKSIARADVVVLMIEADQGPTEQDKKIAAKILEERKGCLLVVNKWDLADDVTQKEYERALRREMFFLYFAPVLFVSARSGLNVRRSIEAMDHVAAQVSAELTTGVLNRVLHDAFARVQPPLVHGRRLKLYYGAETGTRPVRVRLFVNDPALRSAA